MKIPESYEGPVVAVALGVVAFAVLALIEVLASLG